MGAVVAFPALTLVLALALRQRFRLLVGEDTLVFRNCNPVFFLVDCIVYAAAWARLELVSGIERMINWLAYNTMGLSGRPSVFSSTLFLFFSASCCNDSLQDLSNYFHLPSA